MVDLIITGLFEGPATLFTRNFRVHSGIPIGLYTEGPRAPVALIYGDISEDVLRSMSEYYSGLIGLPSIQNDCIPDPPYHYETMTVKAPILATLQTMVREGFTSFVKTFEGGPLVFIGTTNKVPTLLFAADLIKSTIRILSGEMEQETGTDSLGRLNAPPESIIYAPGVSFHFNLIENAIRHIYKRIGIPLLSIPRWPHSSPLAVFLSHDVDVVRKWTTKRMVYETALGVKELFYLQGKRLKNTVASISEAMRNRDPYWMFDELLIMESGNGFSSTWFFAPFGGEYNNRENEYDPVYHRRPAEITAMIRRIVEHGSEVALHGTRRAHLDSHELKKQQESFENRLGFKLRGVRHHYLMFQHGKTLEAAAEAGLLYDTTLGFSNRSGFRNGIATPFFPYISSHPAGKIVEIPLTFMDSVFLHGDDDLETGIRKVTESYLYAKAAGGLFSVLIHPSNMDHMEIPRLSNFYHSLISRFRFDKALSMTGIELAQWWIAREQVLKNLEFTPQIWRMKGISIPENMDFNVTAPDIKTMKFTIEGAKGISELNRDRLIIRPGPIDPGKGITIHLKSTF